MLIQILIKIEEIGRFKGVTHELLAFRAQFLFILHRQSPSHTPSGRSWAIAIRCMSARFAFPSVGSQ